VTTRVLVPQPIAPAGLEVLREAGLETRELDTTDAAELRQAIVGCAGVLVRTAPLPADVLSAAPGLEVVSRHGVGLDAIDIGYCRDHGIRVTFAPESNTVTVAEHTIGLMTAITKNLRTVDVATRAGDFGARSRCYGVELDGKTLGVVGLGRIGRLVAQKARLGFGMRILGYDAYLTEDTGPEGVHRCTLEELLANSDVVTVHVPFTPGSRHVIDAAGLGSMKRGAYLVNCSRGGTVDEAALIDALRDGHLAGAGLDVFETEPLPAGHPLTALDNVLLTPHMAAHSTEALDRMAAHAAEGIVDVLGGREPRWPADRPPAGHRPG
jgi:D-3-phosphoglycerate dehydrogenase / 2-oxoglutarate reductase